MSPAWRSAAKLLTSDGARRIAANIAKLPELLGTYDASAGLRPNRAKEWHERALRPHANTI